MNTFFYFTMKFKAASKELNVLPLPVACFIKNRYLVLRGCMLYLICNC